MSVIPTGDLGRECSNHSGSIPPKRPSISSHYRRPSFTTWQQAVTKNGITEVSQAHNDLCEKNLLDQANMDLLHSNANLLQNSGQWESRRHLGHRILHNPFFEQTIVLIVFVQLGISIYMTDLTAEKEDGEPESEEPAWFIISNFVFLAIYVFELALRFYVYRDNFFQCKWHCLDLFVVSCDILSNIVGILTDKGGVDVSLCRLLRILRVARAGRLLRYFPEIFVMVKSLAGAFRVVFWSFLIIGVLLVMWSLVAVSYIHPLNLKIASPECKHVYSTVFDSMLTFIQTIVAGDSFGLCNIPLMRAHPYLLFFFLSVLGSVGMGLMNLVLSAIVDRAAEVREENNQLLNLTRLHFYKEAKEIILKYCEKEDIAKSGLIEYDKIINAYQQGGLVQEACDTLDVTERDMASVFHMMDDNASNHVDYSIFADHLLKLKTDNQHSTVVMIKQQLAQLTRNIRQEMQALKDELTKYEPGQSLSVGVVGSASASLWSTTAIEQSRLRIAEAQEKTIVEESEERYKDLLETMRSATKLMQDNGLEVGRLGESLLDLQESVKIEGGRAAKRSTVDI